MRPAVRCEQVAIGGVVGIAEEGLLPAVAALRDMVRQTGKDISSQARHRATMSLNTVDVNLAHCHRNPGHKSIAYTAPIIHSFSIKLIINMVKQIPNSKKGINTSETLAL